MFIADPESYTRRQVHLTEMRTSYLDYFMIKDLQHTDFTIDGRMGGSDHNRITTILTGARPLRNKEGPEINSAKLRKHTEQIKRALTEHCTDDPRRGIQIVLSKTKRLNARRPQRYQSYYTPNALIDKMMKDPKKDINLLRNKIREMNNKKYIDFLQEITTSKLENRIKEYYMKIIGTLKLKQDKNTLVNSLQTSEGELIVDPAEIDQNIAEHYREMYSAGYRYKVTQEVGHITNISTDTMKNATSNISLNKAISYDMIPDTILKTVDDKLCQTLTNLLNSFFRTREIPEDIASSRLFCVNKIPGSTPNIGKLRPIAISSVILKLIEAVTLDDIKPKLLRLHKAQAGFIRNGETGLNLIRVIGKLKAIQARQNTSNKYFLTFVDLRAAFDRVDHMKLLDKAKTFGLSDNTLNILRLLYNNAKLRVGKEVINVNRGVPQGSLISPFLFDIYIDDLLIAIGRIIGDENVFAFADDLLFLTCGAKETETAILRLNEWCHHNDMEVNEEKTKVLVLCKKKGMKSLKLKKIGGYHIVSEYKYLGITIDCSLTMDSYVELLKKKVKSFQINIPKLLINTISLKVRLELWKVFVSTHLSYAFGILAILPSKVKAFEVVYMKTLKQACKLHLSTESTRILKALEIWTPKTLILHSFSRLVRKLREQGTQTRTLEIQWQEYIRNKGLAIDLISSTQEDYLAEMESYNSRLLGNNPEEITTMQLKDILVTGDKRDSYLVKFWTGGILDMQNYKHGGKYNISDNRCAICEIPGTQQHYTEACPLMTTERDEMVEGLHKAGMDIKNEEIFRIIKDLKTHSAWSNIAKSERIVALSCIKDYVLATHQRLKEHLKPYEKPDRNEKRQERADDEA